MKLLTFSAAAALTFTLAGCGGSSSSQTEAPDDSAGSSGTQTARVYTVTIDATSQTDYAYLSLESGGVVTPADPKDDLLWDLAFRRSSFIMNGGDSGSKGVMMAYTGNNADFYDTSGEPLVDVFNAATADSELADFTDVTAADATTDYSSDVFTPAVTGDGSEAGWWLYDATTHAVSGNDDLYFLVRSGAQDNAKYAYARLRGKSIVSNGDRNVTLGISVQTTAMGSGFLAEEDVLFTLSEANAMTQCYRFDTQNVNDCSGEWDIKVQYANRSYVIRTNGGESGSGSGRAFSIGSDPDTYGGADTPLDGDISAISTQYWLSDVMQSNFGKYSAEYGWGEYSLNGDHKISPNYRVYLLKSGETTYAVQILSYYHPETLESAHITLRYREVQ